MRCNFDARFAKFWLSSSLCSLHNQNPTPKMANAIFGSPTRRPVGKLNRYRKNEKRNIENYGRKERYNKVECTAYNERFHASGGVCPQTVLC